MVVFPNAKINLGLNILRRRPDGYHDISTIMLPINWCDILEIVPAKGNATTLHTSGRNVDCPQEKNLVYKAYKALDAITPIPPVDIYLRKIIPDGAGLGGGSSDAAFTLKALNKIFELGYTDSQLAETAASLGADCPFFISNTPTLATGTGTTLSPIKVPDMSAWHIVVIKPEIHISTAEAYSNVNPCESAPNIESLIMSPVELWRDTLKNDFEQSVTDSHPEIEEIKQSLYNQGALYASMSGSGSAVYGIFRNAILAESAAMTHSTCVTYLGKII